MLNKCGVKLCNFPMSCRSCSPVVCVKSFIVKSYWWCKKGQLTHMSRPLPTVSCVDFTWTRSRSNTWAIRTIWMFALWQSSCQRLSVWVLYGSVGRESLNVSIKQVSLTERTPLWKRFRQSQGESGQGWAQRESCWVTQLLSFPSASHLLIFPSIPPLHQHLFPLLVVFFFPFTIPCIFVCPPWTSFPFPFWFLPCWGSVLIPDSFMLLDVM